LGAAIILELHTTRGGRPMPLDLKGARGEYIMVKPKHKKKDQGMVEGGVGRGGPESHATQRKFEMKG